nr:PREDICTED: probable cytochrome P450 6a13 isoform X1 [Bemisia tabaci]
MEIVSVLFLVLVGIVSYNSYYVHKKHQYWKRRGVPSMSTWEILVQSVKLWLGRTHVWMIFMEMHDAFRGHKFGGSFQMVRPSLVLRDPELIRSVLVNNFSNFHDRHNMELSENDPVHWDLVHQRGPRWNQVRQKAAQAFSSVKLRLLYQTLLDCARELDAHIMRLCLEQGQEGAEFCLNELMSNYSMEVIGASALGIKCNAIQNPECQLRRVLELSMKFSFRRFSIWTLESICPGLSGKLGFRMHESAIIQFFRSIIEDVEAMKRKDTEPNRKDFLQILMNLRDSEQQSGAKTDEDSAATGSILTETVMLGVISSFLSVGYEAVASTLVFCLYELAFHPEIQHKLLQEVHRVHAKAGGGISFEDTKKLQFMEQVISETLRKYPVSAIIGRCCTEPFQIPDTTVVVEKDVTCFISILALHYDPKYFPDPETFDPDRFARENLDKIVPGSYLPFGDGPRSCIANRLVVMIVKTMLMTLIPNYTFHPSARTPRRMEFDVTRFMLAPKANLQLRLQRRK